MEPARTKTGGGINDGYHSNFGGITNYGAMVMEWAILILAGLTFVGQMLEVFLSWYILREVGDLDGDKKDWWEKNRKEEDYVDPLWKSTVGREQ